MLMMVSITVFQVLFFALLLLHGVLLLAQDLEGGVCLWHRDKDTGIG